MLRYKEVKRRKFTPKQLELLEKCHWLHIESFRGYDADKEEMRTMLLDKIFMKLLG